jgi:hypothetical protein
MRTMGVLIRSFSLACLVSACAAETGELDADSIQLTDNLLRLPQQYSAYDGEHDYPVIAGIARKALAAKSGVDWPSVRWIFDDQFLEQTDYYVLDGSAGDALMEVAKYDLLAGTAVFKTKRTGSTRIGVVFRTLDGEPMHGEAKLQISRASLEEWALGEAYFYKSSMIQQYPARGGLCGTPEAFDLGTHTSCVGCHNAIQPFSPCTPLQTAGYSDEQLLDTISRGALPPSVLDWSEFLRSAPDPACIFDDWHSPDIDDATARGLVWRLRSLLPEIPRDLDLGLAIQPIEREQTLLGR